jgi:hypothetical protein
MFFLALILAALSIGANLYATALSSLMGEATMAGFFLVAAVASAFGIFMGFSDAQAFAYLMAVATLASIAGIGVLAIEMRKAEPSPSAKPAKLDVYGVAMVGGPIAPPMLSSMLAFLL